MKAVFFDIDGTLVSHGDRIMPESTKLALQKLKEQNIMVFIATGRPHSSAVFMDEYFEFDGYVCNNGTNGIFRCQQIIDIQIPNESLEVMIEYVRSQKLKVGLSTEEGVYYGGVAGVEYDSNMPVKPIEQCLQDRIYQVNLYAPPEADRDFLAHLPNSKSVRWTERFADIISAEGGKEVGIRKFLAMLNIEESEIAVFGDGENDLTMLRAFKNSVAMGNANDIVKENANFVTDHILEDGIYNALKKFKVIE